MVSEQVKGKGRHLASIAFEKGFASAQELFEVNEALSAKKTPDVVGPGTWVEVPPLEPKTVSLRPNQPYRVVVRRPRYQLRLCLLDPNRKPLVDQSYTLRWKGRTWEGVTDRRGMLEQMLPANAEVVELAYEHATRGLVVVALQVGGLAPLISTLGMQQRLSNLGFGSLCLDGVEGPQTKAALQRFQRFVELLDTGEFDPHTRKALRDHHGC